MTRKEKRPPVGKMSLAAMMRELERTAGKPRPKKKAPKKRRPKKKSLATKVMEMFKPAPKKRVKPRKKVPAKKPKPKKKAPPKKVKPKKPVRPRAPPKKSATKPRVPKRPVVKGVDTLVYASNQGLPLKYIFGDIGRGVHDVRLASDSNGMNLVGGDVYKYSAFKISLRNKGREVQTTENYGVPEETLRKLFGTFKKRQEFAIFKTPDGRMRVHKYDRWRNVTEYTIHTYTNRSTLYQKNNASLTKLYRKMRGQADPIDARKFIRDVKDADVQGKMLDEAGHITIQGHTFATDLIKHHSRMIGNYAWARGVHKGQLWILLRFPDGYGIITIAPIRGLKAIDKRKKQQEDKAWLKRAEKDWEREKLEKEKAKKKPPKKETPPKKTTKKRTGKRAGRTVPQGRRFDVRLENTEGTANKFWGYTMSGNKVDICWGPIGKPRMQTQTKEFRSSEEARVWINKLAMRKMSKGYLTA